jgi:hypothetical protein
VSEMNPMNPRHAMTLVRRAAAGAAALLAMAAAPVLAQDHSTAAGYGGGFVNFGALNPDAGAEELLMDAGWIMTAFGETWHVAGGRMGARLNGAWTQRPLDLGGDDIRDINTWMLDASLLLRLLPPRPGGGVAPFLRAGGGLIHYGLGTGPPQFYTEQGVVYSGDDQMQWTAVFGGGIDIVPGGLRIGGTPLGLRVEVADHVVFRSPFRGIDDDARLGPIHNLRFGASLIGVGWF